MPLPDDRDEFEAAFRAAVGAVLPTATVDVVARTIVAIKLRVDLDEERFIDVFFNERNRRTDVVLIERVRRVFAYDNLGHWHYHPPGNPQRHEAFAEPDVEEFVRTTAGYSRKV